MCLPVDRSLACANPTIVSNEAYAKDIQHKLAVYEQVAMQNVKDSALQHSKAHNTRVTQPTFKTGDKVLLFDSTTSLNESAKLKVRWVGPYLITDVLPNYNYKLKHLVTGKELRRPVHASRIRPLREMDNDYRLSGSRNDVMVHTATTEHRKINLRISVGDLLQCQADVIVNPVSTDLDLSRGLSRELVERAGPELQLQMDQLRSSSPALGTVIVSKPCNLNDSVKTVYSVVLPNADSLADDSQALNHLTAAYFNCLQTIDSSHTCSTIALPALGGGRFGYSIWVVAQAAAEAVKLFDSQTVNNCGSLSCIELVLFTTTNADIFTTVFKQYFTSVQNTGATVSQDAKATTDPVLTGQSVTNSPTKDVSGGWYEIERIIKHRRVRSKDEYLVKWKGYDEQSCVRREDITDGALQQFYANKRRRVARRRRVY